MSMTFEEASKLMRTGTRSEALLMLLERHEEFIELVNSIDAAGADVLKEKSDEYIISLLSFVESIALTQLMQNGYSGNVVIRNMDNPEFLMFCDYLIKLSIGLSVMEELR